MACQYLERVLAASHKPSCVMMESMDLAAAIKQKALDVGFDLAGIARVEPGHDLEYARQWFEGGYAGEMAYLANPKRYDPHLVLPSVTSVICVGLVYDTEHSYSTEVCGSGGGGQKSASSGQKREVRSPDSPGGPARGWISRYAWGTDYHEVVRARLDNLRRAIELLVPGAEARAFVDSGPVIERAFARFSGIGWMGKNTCVINEGKGSWFFLGVILTNLKLDPDLPAPDRCGSCTACLEACPTGALIGPYGMDAQRCISYLTIELKGSIPEVHRPAIGANVFGCDICQDVCPWNSRKRRRGSDVRGQEASFQPLEGTTEKPETGNAKAAFGPQPLLSSPFSLLHPPLAALTSLTEERFHRIFVRSPIKRARYRGWLRNLCVAIGNSGDGRFVPRLEELVRHPDPLVREHAAWALKRLRG